MATQSSASGVAAQLTAFYTIVRRKQRFASKSLLCLLFTLRRQKPPREALESKVNVSTPAHTSQTLPRPSQSRVPT